MLTRDEITSKLDEDQVQVLDLDQGRVWLAAEAGSGKTRSATWRVIDLLRQGVPPHQILAISFTNDAADEMKHRLVEYGPSRAANQVICTTFHKLCLRVARGRGLFGGEFSILGPGPQIIQLDKLSRGIHGWRTKSPAGDATRLFGLAKANIIERRGGLQACLVGAKVQFAKEVDPSDWGRFQELWESYEVWKADKGSIDLSDQIWRTYWALVDDPRALDLVRRQVRYFILDEAQDCTPIMFQLAELMVSDREFDLELTRRTEKVPRGLLMAVGDHNQSIYQFRGVSHEFNSAWMERARVVLLARNYRSRPIIVALANALIRPIRHKALADEMIAMREPGGSAEVRSFVSPRHEAEVIAKEIEPMRGGLHNIAIIYRLNVQALAIELTLIRAGIPYRVRGAGFFRSREVQDVLAYLRLALGDDVKSLVRVCSRPKRFLGRVFTDKYIERAIDGGPMVDVRSGNWGRSTKSVHSLRDDLLRLRRVAAQGDLGRTIDTIFGFKQTGRPFMNFLDSVRFGNVKGKVDQSRYETLLVLRDVIGRYPSIRRFLDFAQKAVAESNDESTHHDRVVLTTVHGAKGLEWPYVYAIGWNQNTLPSRRGDPEEERRIAYVAVTRARKRLSISWSRTDGGEPLGPSEFLEELKPVPGIIWEDVEENV